MLSYYERSTVLCVVDARMHRDLVVTKRNRALILICKNLNRKVVLRGSWFDCTAVRVVAIANETHGIANVYDLYFTEPPLREATQVPPDVEVASARPRFETVPTRLMSAGSQVLPLQLAQSQANGAATLRCCCLALSRMMPA